MAKEIDSTVFSQMQTGEPFASYIKTILGKVYVQIINPWNGELEGLILEGDPKKKQDSCIVDVWNSAHDAYFRRVNKKHFELGELQKYERPIEYVEEKSPNELTEEDVANLLDGHKTQFLKLKSKLGEITSEVPLFRILEKARELEKSEKLIKAIEARLSEVQALDYKTE